MKRIRKDSVETKVVRTTAVQPVESKEPQVTDRIHAGSGTRKGTTLQIVTDKTREQLCDELFCQLDKAAGVPLEVATRIVGQMTSSLVWPKMNDKTELLIKAISTLSEYTPRNLIEASLAVQMTATSEMALMFLNRATLAGQTTEGIDQNVARAARLMRIHLEQIEAMQKLKGKTGQQKVTVEHVHVHDGGQAIVGAVNTGKKRG